MTAIQVDQLSVSYGDTKVINELSLTIHDGEFFTLLGPSGCGKTTLLRTIAGFITPVAGRLSFDDADVTRVPTHRRDIGMVFQDYALFPDKTVNTNVAYGLKARHLERSAIPNRVEEALEQVGMTGYGDRLPGELSGGQRQRVALARALAIRPRVLLMDEPLSNLDTKLRLSIREAIGDLQRELGITTVFVTHDQEEALALSDRIALFRSGNIDQLGTPDEIYRRPASSYAADFIGAANVLPVKIADDAATNDETVTVSLGSASLRGIRRTALRAGSAYAVARPEHLRLLPGDGHSDPSHEETGSSVIPGEVIRHQYLGYKHQYSVRLTDGTVIASAEPASGSSHSAGDLVSVVFPTAETLVMAS